MKQTKILAMLLALVMLFTFAACAKEEAQKPAQSAETVAETVATAAETATEETAAEGSVTVLIVTAEGKETVEVALADLGEGATLLDALKAEPYAEQFQADITEGDYVMVNSVKGLVPDAANNEYVAIYATDMNFVDADSEFTTTAEVDGVTFYTTNVGAADLVLAAGESYLFQIATFS